jgi:hypothetical protein
VAGHRPHSHALQDYRRLVQRLLAGGIPQGEDFEACRALLRSGEAGESTLQLLCTLMEGALSDPELDIDSTQVLVPLLKALARGTVDPGDLL